MHEYDFAISYAGEDRLIAEDIYNKIKEEYGDYSVFLAENEKHQFAGKDGESFFEDLFSKSKQVIVIISKYYKQKKWPRFEWDVILERSAENRFIPIKLDDTKIIGLPSNIIYVPYEKAYGEGFEDMLRRKPNTNKIRKTLNWEPKISLTNTLANIIRFEKEKND